MAVNKLLLRFVYNAIRESPLGEDQDEKHGRIALAIQVHWAEFHPGGKAPPIPLFAEAKEFVQRIDDRVAKRVSSIPPTDSEKRDEGVRRKGKAMPNPRSPEPRKYREKGWQLWRRKKPVGKPAAELAEERRRAAVAGGAAAPMAPVAVAGAAAPVAATLTSKAGPGGEGSCNVYGFVTDEKRNPITNATVTADTGDAEADAASAVTDDKGRYILRGIPPGDVTVSATIPGPEGHAPRTQRKQISLEPGRNKRVDFIFAKERKREEKGARDGRGGKIPKGLDFFPKVSKTALVVLLGIILANFVQSFWIYFGVICLAASFLIPEVSELAKVRKLVKEIEERYDPLIERAHADGDNERAEHLLEEKKHELDILLLTKKLKADDDIAPPGDKNHNQAYWVLGKNLARAAGVFCIGMGFIASDPLSAIPGAKFIGLAILFFSYFAVSVNRGSPDDKEHDEEREKTEAEEEAEAEGGG